MVGPVPVNFLKLEKVYVKDAYGGEVHLPGFWKDTPAILIFLRHFGCPACRGHAQDVWKNKEKYQKAGAKIVFIGNGNSAVIEQFIEDLDIKGAPVYIDNTFESFKACGFRKVDDPYDEEGMKNINKAMAKGMKAVDYEGVADGTQLGGVIAIRPGNQVTFHYISRTSGDYPVDVESN